MAEAVIVGIAGQIIVTLIPQALEKVEKLRSIKHELEVLKDKVSTLRAVLEDAEEQYYQSRQIQFWLEKLKDAFYDAQDVLEEFNIEAMRRELRGHNEMIKEVKTFFSSSNQLDFKLKMRYKVRAVRERIEAIKADRGFNLDERPTRVRRKREETHSFKREEEIIGRDDDKKKVMKFLMNSNMKEHVSILPIVGIGGLGKTALAQFVYNEETVTRHFDLKMWICVSNDFDLKKMVKNMIACVKKKEPTAVAMEQLQSEMRGEIDGKKYLLVLDDLWNVEQESWLNLKTLLVGGVRGSKILITTRLPLVAKITGTTPPHLLKGLSESASFDLLVQMACCTEKEIQDPDMLAIGKDIVRKCSGVPLVVRTVGSILFKKSKHEWSQFKENKLPYVSQREESIKSVLRLSYDNLPSHLKQCFAFCSLFPKDYEIKKKTLVDLWVAGGFIQPSNTSQYLEDIAHEYFMDLLWSNFFQDFQKDSETCKMHDLMHDLACLVAGTECWVAWDDRKSLHERTRHMSSGSTSNFMGTLPISRLKANSLRTFLLATPKPLSLEMGQRGPTREADLRPLIQNFKSLRILDLHATNVIKVPRSICKLKHLTYLDLSYNYALKRLSNSITRLQNLQTLNLYSCKSLEELPRGIRKLVSLQNLDIDDCSKLSYVPRELGQLSSLHRLTRFILAKDKTLAKNCCRLGELNRLNSIRGSLHIENLGSVTNAIVESRAANLIGKHSLQSLALEWGNFDTNDVVIGDRDEALLDGLKPHSNLHELRIDGYKGESFPRWMTDGLVSSLPNLVGLQLLNCKRCRHFPQFGLNKLKSLEILRMQFLECLSEEYLKSLTSLESLRIGQCHRITSLSLGMQHLSNLVHLEIWSCAELDISKDQSGNILNFHGLQSLRNVQIWSLPKLASLPRWLLQLTNLKHLEISRCNNLKTLSEQISALQSLQRLEIYYCPLVTSLPEGMRRLASLTHLCIIKCPKLEARCKRNAGEDWCKIAHIPHITIVP